MPIVSMVGGGPNERPNENLSPKKPVFPRSLQSLKRPGVNIISFSSTVDNESI
jgi:hypothetical protein